MTPGQLTFPGIRRLEPRRSRDLMADAIKWIDANPAAWRDLVRIAKTEALTIGRVRVKSYIEELRGSSQVARPEGSPVKIPNALSAPFGRILRAWYPQLRPFVPIAHSKVDGCAIPPCPRQARL